jgi:hypothetical protein
LPKDMLCALQSSDHFLWPQILFLIADSLVLNIQFFYDGYLSQWASVDDIDAHSKEWLCKICPWRWWSGNYGDYLTLQIWSKL